MCGLIWDCEWTGINFNKILIIDSTNFVNIGTGACDIFIVTKKQPQYSIYTLCLSK